jgi:hypothetical protein
MITLISDKFTLVKESFSIRDPIHQGLGDQHRDRQFVPRASHPTKRRFEAALTYTVWWGGTAPIRGLCILAC